MYKERKTINDDIRNDSLVELVITGGEGILLHRAYEGNANYMQFGSAS
jgi:hypothetical protein